MALSLPLDTKGGTDGTNLCPIIVDTVYASSSSNGAWYLGAQAPNLDHDGCETRKPLDVDLALGKHPTRLYISSSAIFKSMSTTKYDTYYDK